MNDVEVIVNLNDQGPQGIQGAGYLATSSTSLACAGSGSVSFITQAGLAYSAGARVRASSASGEWMEGAITSYSGTTLVASMDLNNGTFNDQGLAGLAFFSANRTYSATTLGEVNTEIRNEFLAWSDDIVIADISGGATGGMSNDSYFIAIGFDGATVSGGGSAGYSNTANFPINAMAMKGGLAEGYHYATLLARETTSTVTLYGGSLAEARTTLQTYARRG